MSANSDLVTWARDAATKGEDLFTLLSVDATSSESDIRRAFRRKALTAHPDKAGDAYDPALYERLEKARDALIDLEARKVYDDGMRAAIQKRAQLEQMSERRRQLVEDLERREAAAKRQKTEVNQVKPDAEAAASLARGRAIREEKERLKREAEERERLREEQEKRAKESVAEGAPAPREDDYDARIAELERKIEEKRRRKMEKKLAKKGGAKEPSPPPPQNPSPGTTEADSCKEPLAAEVESTPTPTEPGQNPSGNKFAATMARLKAAQAKRDAEKLKKAEEEAAKASM